MDIVVNSSGLTIGDKSYKYSIGRGGLSVDRKEGDGTTPIGTFPIRRILYRADRVSIESNIETNQIKELDGWCTDPSHPEYNQQIELPHQGSHENLYRDDNIYDIIIVVGFNDDPAIPGYGSAIFIHIARDGYTPTDGCVAVSREDMLEIVKAIDKESRLVITDD